MLPGVAAIDETLDRSTAAAGTAVPAVRIESVSKTYGDIEAIRRADFAVAEGEFLSILGPSGCGKSTLLMMVAGLLGPSNGRVLIGERPVDGPRPDVGVVFQSPVLLPWRTVLENVMLPVEMQRLPRAAHLGRARELLAVTHLEEFADRLPRELSGGMRQRVSICRALVIDPRMLLMDEPFSALDAITRDEMGQELLRLWQIHRKTVIFVTHSIREAAFLSDRVIVMGQRPATIVADVRIELPRPRALSIEETEPFNRYVRMLRQAIEASHAR
jgi:NitT/TauT family transport system ATP-binding protein